MADDDEISRLIGDSVASYAAATGTLARARAQYISTEPVSHSAWSEMAGSGWTSMLLAERHGGSAMGLSAAAALHQELGAGLVPEPLLFLAQIKALVLNNCATSAGLDADAPVAVAWQGAHGALFAEQTGLRLSHGTLAGKAFNVVGVGGAEQVIAAVREDEGTGLFVVPAAAFRQTLFRLADGTCGAHLLADAIGAGAITRLAPATTGGAILDRALDAARVLAAAELLGVMRRMFDLTLDYLRTRRQFGRPIGANQALQHRAVDLYVQIELTAAAVELAAEQMAAADNGDVRHGHIHATAASAAKARASDAAFLLGREAVQLHGAIAYTLEHDLCLYLARAMTTGALLGNGPAHRRRYAALVAATAA